MWSKYRTPVPLPYKNIRQKSVKGDGISTNWSRPKTLVEESYFMLVLQCCREKSYLVQNCQFWTLHLWNCKEQWYELPISLELSKGFLRMKQQVLLEKLIRLRYGNSKSSILISVADPDRVLFWPLDPGYKKIRNCDYISERLVKFFGLKILKFFDANPRSFWPWIRDGNIPIRDPG